MSLLRCSTFLTIIVAIGCGGAPAGPKMYPVTGTLTVGGKPIESVNVQLIPQEMTGSAVISAGKTDSAGKFSVMGTNGHTGAVPGKYKVVLSVIAPPPSPEDREKYQGQSPVEAPFPKEYASAATTPKDVEVTNQAVTLDLKL